jgi:hypothetical protein
VWNFGLSKDLVRHGNQEAIMGELYRQRAAECERMALKHPEESRKLRETAETWRLIAEATEEATVH